MESTIAEVLTLKNYILLYIIGVTLNLLVFSVFWNQTLNEPNFRWEHALADWVTRSRLNIVISAVVTFIVVAIPFSTLLVLAALVVGFIVSLPFVLMVEEYRKRRLVRETARKVALENDPVFLKAIKEVEQSLGSNGFNG